MRRLRVTLISGGAVIAAGAVLAGTVLASASGPVLPHRTPAQLLAAMQGAKLPSAATATITESASLGFPAVPNLDGMPSAVQSAASWLAGSHTVQVWYDGPQHVRVALPVSFGETDLRVNGGQVWLWDSRTQTATHILPPSATAMIGRPIFIKPPRLRPACLRFFGQHARSGLREFQPSQSLPRSVRACLPFRLPKFCARPQVRAVPLPARPAGGLGALSPIQIARRLLALVGPTTKVSVAGTTTVAGRPGYELAIAPRSSKSLIGQIVIAVDAATALPLQVQVFARGSSSPAFSLGFTSLTIGRPAMSNFTFTPPPGAHVKVVHLPDPLAGLTAAGPLSFPRRVMLRPRPAFGCPFLRLRPHIAAGPRVIGSGWLSVLALPPNPAVTGFLAGGHPAAAPAGPAAQYLPWLHVLLNSAARVNGAWGSGRLLRTALFSVLVTSNGQVFAGAVTPDVLTAAASRATIR